MGSKEGKTSDSLLLLSPAIGLSPPTYRLRLVNMSNTNCGTLLFVENSLRTFFPHTK